MASDLVIPEGFLLQAHLVEFGQHTSAGRLVRAVAVPWFEIISRVRDEPEFLSQFAAFPERLEELIAAAYDKAGWPTVEITPRSGDGGRDVIATKPGLGSVRFLEQAKAYSPGRLVTHKDVREMLVSPASPPSGKGAAPVKSYDKVRWQSHSYIGKDIGDGRHPENKQDRNRGAKD